MEVLAISAAAAAFIGLIFAYGLASWLGKASEGTDSMKELSVSIKKSTMTFFKQEYKVMIPVVLIMSVLLGFAIDWPTAVLFFAGALFSALACFFGVRGAVRGYGRTADAAMNGGLNQALKIAFRSGTAMGLCTAGLGLLGIGGAFVALGVKSAAVITGFGFGASTAALFGSVAGGIAVEYSGKTKNIGSDLFGYYTGAIISAVVIGAATRVIKPDFGYPYDLPALEGTVFPLLVAAFGILASIAGIMFVRGNEKENPAVALNIGKYLANILVVLLTALLSYIFFGNFNGAISAVIGMLAGSVTGKITNTYTLGNSRYHRKAIDHSQAGSPMISDYGIGMMSTLWPMAVIAAAILAANGFGDYYGISMAAVGMLSTTGIVATIDALGPVCINAGQIVGTTRCSEETKTAMDKLIATGESNAAAGKGFAIAAAVMTAFALYLAYVTIAGLETINLIKPSVMAALLLGAMLTVLLSAMMMNSAEKAAIKVIAAPGLLAVLAPLAVGIGMGTQALGGLLVGALTSGVMAGIILSNTGGKWNRSEKSAAGDPLKDAARVSVNVFMLLMVTTAVVFAPAIAVIRDML